MGYFSKFNRIGYEINGDGSIQALVNLTSSVAISTALIDNVAFYNYVTVNDGERMEQLSQRLYGTPDYYWSFLLINPNLKNIWNDWPKGNQQLLEYCDRKFPDIAAVISDSSLNSSKFSIGDCVYFDDKINPSGIDHGRQGKVESIYTNNGYIVLEPVYRCSDETSQDKDTCEAAGASWSASDLVTQFSGNDNIEVIGQICQNTSTLEELTDENGDIIKYPYIDQTTCNAKAGYNWVITKLACDKIVNHKDAPHHYIEDATGNVVSTASAGVTPISHYEFEEWLNDKNRQIKIIKPEFIRDIVKEFEKEIGK